MMRLMGPFLIATGVALIPCAAFGAALVAMAPAGGRRAALRHPIRTLGAVLRDNNEPD
jgi:hypothetical protein